MIDIVPYNVATGNGAQLKSLLANARRPAMCGRADALRLVRLMQEGGLWWEPHDPDFPHFHAYADAQGKDRLATTLKRTTHKAHDQAVYSVEVMGLALPGVFHHVAAARAAGSAAWKNRA